MTRKSEGATAGLRRGRTLATAGLGAATLIGGLIYAMPANAAAPLSASVSMPTAISNNGTDVEAFTATVDNSGVATAQTNLRYKFDLTVPGDANCAGVTIAPNAGGADTVGPALTQSGCEWSSATGQGVAASTAVTYDYNISLNAATATGTMTTKFVVDQDNAIGGFQSTLLTATDTTTVVTPGPAVFATPTPATIKQAYSQQLFTPAAGGSAPSYTVYKSGTTTDASGTVTTCYSVVQATTTTAASVPLNSNLVLDETTGKVTAEIPAGLPSAGNPGPAGEKNVAGAIAFATDSAPASYIVVVNNGKGGATTPAAGTACSTGAGTYASIPVLANDVSSGAFTVPVLFKDVPLTAKFAPAIYFMGNSGASTGYADGTFQPATSISRQAMAAQIEGSGGASTTCAPNSSPYSDLPWTSQFCNAIADTSGQGIFNGYAGGTFHPTANISRQAISAVMFRLDSIHRLGETSGDAACTLPVPFNDVSAQSPFCGDIEWMKTNKLSAGYTDGGFHPTAPASRQAVAQFFYQLNALENP